MAAARVLQPAKLYVSILNFVLLKRLHFPPYADANIAVLLYSGTKACDAPTTIFDGCPPKKLVSLTGDASKKFEDELTCGAKMSSTAFQHYRSVNSSALGFQVDKCCATRCIGLIRKRRCNRVKYPRYDAERCATAAKGNTGCTHPAALLSINLASRRQLPSSQMNSDEAEATSVIMSRKILKTAMLAMLLVTSEVPNRLTCVFTL